MPQRVFAKQRSLALHHMIRVYQVRIAAAAIPRRTDDGLDVSERRTR